jgi:hypothetical protein
MPIRRGRPDAARPPTAGQITDQDPRHGAERLHASLIVASRNRAAKVPAMLTRLPGASMAARVSVLVDSASEDDTLEVMQAFCGRWRGALRVEIAASTSPSGIEVAAATDRLQRRRLLFRARLFRRALSRFDPALTSTGPARCASGNGRRSARRLDQLVILRRPKKLIPPKTAFRRSRPGRQHVFPAQGARPPRRLAFLLDGDADARMSVEASLALLASCCAGSSCTITTAVSRAAEAMRSVENTLSRGAYSAFLLARGLATPWAAWDRSRLRPLTSGERLRLVQLEFEAPRDIADAPATARTPAEATQCHCRAEGRGRFASQHGGSSAV